MDIILVPGFWLDGASWSEVTPVLEAAGHRVHALTLPGLESVTAPRAGVRLRTHIDAVVGIIDSLNTPVVLVGHSGGGAIIHGAIDARPHRIARGIYVDSGPVADGGVINDDLTVEGDEIPLPPWEDFDDADLVGLNEELRAAFRARAVPQPRGVAYDQQILHDERRYDVPVTVIACEFAASALAGWIAQGDPHVSELARIRDVEYVDLPTGHWPQFTRPLELGAVIVSAIDR
ncbi:alpha/beta hydrolase [Cryobacterium sp. PH29-G1]|uniref:alpha/beta fold hydrolase n=1 Tax=Cryobacterium sp. PH29-G1 TaxID=3046211 RepID=UPI0024B8D2C9|nr:alpha/beta hydrolase [Cryobacterium sp. PH29-G1]MDJ0350509.1 alpha/beta hydrolase [Cryobacterium sp. PH29-G1]